MCAGESRGGRVRLNRKLRLNFTFCARPGLPHVQEINIWRLGDSGHCHGRERAVWSRERITRAALEEREGRRGPGVRGRAGSAVAPAGRLSPGRASFVRRWRAVGRAQRMSFCVSRSVAAFGAFSPTSSQNRGTGVPGAFGASPAAHVLTFPRIPGTRLPADQRAFAEQRGSWINPSHRGGNRVSRPPLPARSVGGVPRLYQRNRAGLAGVVTALGAPTPELVKLS